MSRRGIIPAPAGLPRPLPRGSALSKTTFRISLAAAVFALLVLVAYAWWPSNGSRGNWIDPADTQLVDVGRRVYGNYCAACHGQNLQGQPNWRERLPTGRLPAPPHDKTGHTWHHPDAILFDIVKNGLVPGRTAPRGYESDMPAYAGILTDNEIRAVLAYIKSTWPPQGLQMQRKVTDETRANADQTKPGGARP